MTLAFIPPPLEASQVLGTLNLLIEEFNGIIAAANIPAFLGGNVPYGPSALGAITSGTDNTGVGSSAGAGITTGVGNVGVGFNAGPAVGANFSQFVGFSAGQSNTGNSNVGVGAQTMPNGTGADNIAIGNFALFHATDVTRNIAIGSSALASASTNASAQGNTAIGFQCMAQTTNGANTAVGNACMAANTTGAEICAIGSACLLNNTTGILHVAMGVEALFSNTTGNSNTGIGLSALHDYTTGSQNTGLGFGCGLGPNGPNQPTAQISGSNCTWLGAQTGSSTATQLSNATAVGAGCLAGLSNALYLGTAGTIVVYAGETVLGPNSAASGNGAVARTVATLPAASAALKGARSFVTDATAPTFLGALVGGGAVVCPVFCNGAAWVAG